MELKTRTVKSLVGAVIAGVLLCLGAGTALASTLLSGYGGPGEGNQAILGAGLVNLPSGGGPGGGSAGPGGPSAAVPSQTLSSGSSPAAAAGGQGTRAKSRARGTGEPSGTSGAYRAAHAPGAVAAQPLRGAAVGSQPLGLSGSDVLYILLALAALLITALLTRQLARGEVRGARG